MKTYLSLFAISALLISTTASCKKKGCMDPDAVNYNAEAKKDDGTCKYTPTITVNGNNPENINVGDTYTDAGATATNKDGSSVTVLASYLGCNQRLWQRLPFYGRPSNYCWCFS